MATAGSTNVSTTASGAGEWLVVGGLVEISVLCAEPARHTGAVQIRRRIDDGAHSALGHRPRADPRNPGSDGKKFTSYVSIMTKRMTR